MDRHAFLASGLAALTMTTSAGAAAVNDPRIAAIERRAGGRLGVYAVDTGSGNTIAYRAHERFPMCSTFKLLAVGAVLARVDEGNEYLTRRVAIADADLLAYAPIAKAHLRIGSMTIAELCAAAIEWSDNTAANLLLHSLLGPSHVTAFARTIGDPVTRLDRNEPTLNTAREGDLRDTTEPAAMAADMRELVLGNALKPASRTHLRTWLLQAQTGKQKLQRDLPKSWRTGDKTGSGDFNTSNDVAIMWPPDRAPIIVAAYFTRSNASESVRDGALPAVGRVIATRFSAG
jgi:beta-lactamase class A